MQGKFILLAFVVILFFSGPVAASLTKISSGSPVFIGESNLDISSGLLDCHTVKNLTIAKTGQDNAQIFHYTISPDFFTGYTGPWYCQDKQPPRVVFEVLEPQLQIRVWDLDSNKDITGTSVPISSNITYRVDTNLYRALQVSNRPPMSIPGVPGMSTTRSFPLTARLSSRLLPISGRMRPHGTENRGMQTAKRSIPQVPIPSWSPGT
jgi:hypothetical protein